ncbi:hypothetical protein Hdeb2414_s0009g00321751 [Helianthus debilis subsp. tardiflorus]
MDDSTKPMLLNLIAFERCLCSTNDSWVTSYVCLLDSLIDDAADVKVLRKAGVLLNGLGRDQNVANLLHEIGTDLVPSSLAYLRAKRMIQHLYDSIKDTALSKLKHWYIKDPFAFISVFGVVSVFLSVVQTYCISLSGAPKANVMIFAFF